MTVKIYISQPMHGRSNEEIEQERNDIMSIAKDEFGEEAREIASFFKNSTFSSIELLGMGISMMAKADKVYFTPGWEDTYRCRVEHYICENYDVPHEHLDSL